jgi:hypothetical protein
LGLIAASTPPPFSKLHDISSLLLLSNSFKRWWCKSAFGNFTAAVFQQVLLMAVIPSSENGLSELLFFIYYLFLKD